MKFTEALHEYLSHLTEQPDESDGYSDKSFWNERKRLEDQLNDFFAKKL